jgi:alkaline phosphatase D
MMRAFVLMGALACAATAYAQPTFRSNWSAGVERPWAGADYWANPLQDWRVHGGRFENIQPGGDRNLYLLTREISDRSGTLTSTVRLGRHEEESGAAGIGFGGFRVGIRGTFNDYRDSAVRGYGMNAGITADGRLFIARVEEDAPRVRTPMRDLELRLTAKPAPAGYFVLLAAYEPSGRLLAQVERSNVPAAWFPGGIALVSHSGPVEASPQYDPSIVDTGWADKRYTNRGGGVRFWFRDWTVGGTKIDAHPERAFGPILFTLHTLSRGVLKLTAQIAPVQASREPVRLQIRESQNAAWRTVSSAPVDRMSRTATFRVPNWNAGYRVAYRMAGRDYTTRARSAGTPSISRRSWWLPSPATTTWASRTPTSSNT